QSSPEATSAVKFTYNGKEQWLGLNSMVRLFGDSEMYILTYGNRRLPLSFDMYLKNFEVGRYQGTMRAASYQSLVYLTDENREVLISMNEPLQHKGFTFYQASFQEDSMGRPIASVLSVNYDPGRWVKYLGSLLIVFGAIHLFYRRWKKARGAYA
ncbi:cytochrome c biogenesis protein ResB, partial [bacterium]|nr:cytochrome c biogenesis protein ResB [bacterium]